ncbi:hypothetical protein M744_12920 [Synechococcus elongatus UTEX 2973]|nr:hypothetical protein M744_12920 [Synechococcus elongatus UTEX 2973]
MQGGSWFAKSIIESEETIRVKDYASSEFWRFDSAWNGITWRLARQAHLMGTEIGGYRVYKFPGIDAGGESVPSMVLVFEVREDEVEIIDLRIGPPVADTYELDW